MKKKVFGRKLSRGRPAREALFANLIKGVILNGKIVTTKAKAKAIQGKLDKMVTLAKKGGIPQRRKVYAFLDNSKDATDRLFAIVTNTFKERKSGFSRIINLPRRSGDNSQMVRLEWVETVVEEEPKKAERQEKGKKVKTKEVKKVKKESKVKKVAKKTKPVKK